MKTYKEFNSNINKIEFKSDSKRNGALEIVLENDLKINIHREMRGSDYDLHHSLIIKHDNIYLNESGWIEEQPSKTVTYETNTPTKTKFENLTENHVSNIIVGAHNTLVELNNNIFIDVSYDKAKVGVWISRENNTAKLIGEVNYV